MNKVKLWLFRFRLLFRKGWCARHLSKHTEVYLDHKWGYSCQLCKDAADAKRAIAKEKKHWQNEALEDDARRFRNELGIVAHYEREAPGAINYGAIEQRVLAQNPLYAEEMMRQADEALDEDYLPPLGDDMR